MRPWAWARRLLALVVTVVFVLGVVVTPAFAAAKSRSFSAPKSSGGFSGGSRSFTAPKPSSTPSSPSRSFTAPKPSTTTKPSTPTTPPRSFTAPPPSGTSQPSKGYTAPTSPSYSGSDRSYSGPSRSFSGERPTTPAPSIGSSRSTPLPPPVTYERSQTRYPSRPPVIVYAPGPYGGGYWHDWYYGRPWYWRMWHRPVYYGTDGGWAINWWPLIIGGGITLWILLAVLSAYTTRRRRM